MLINDLYTFTPLEMTPGRIYVKVRFDPSHAIFKGHFPGKPVVPGVCLVQAIEEVLGNHLGRDLGLSDAVNIKFLQMIDPQENAEIILEIDFVPEKTGFVKVDASYRENEIIFMKFRGSFH